MAELLQIVNLDADTKTGALGITEEQLNVAAEAWNKFNKPFVEGIADSVRKLTDPEVSDEEKEGLHINGGQIYQQLLDKIQEAEDGSGAVTTLVFQKLLELYVKDVMDTLMERLLNPSSGLAEMMAKVMAEAEKES
jgi:hypothetical protein